VSRNLKEIDVLAYQFAYKVGIIGCLPLTLIATDIELITATFLAILWSLLTFFFFPVFYIWIYKSNVDLPWWGIRGPHQ
jgi:hypothetical protein